MEFEEIDAIVRTKVSIPDGFVLRSVNTHALPWICNYRKKNGFGPDYDMHHTKTYRIHELGGEEIERGSDV